MEWKTPAKFPVFFPSEKKLILPGRSDQIVGRRWRVEWELGGTAGWNRGLEPRAGQRGGAAVGEMGRGSRRSRSPVSGRGSADPALASLL